MLKIELSLLFGEREGNTEIFYCEDEKTHRFYKRTVKTHGIDTTEIIEEVPEEQLENYMYQNEDRLLSTIE